MVRPNRKDSVVTIRLPAASFEKLNEFSAECGESRSTVMEKALDMYMAHWYKENQKEQTDADIKE